MFEKKIVLDTCAILWLASGDTALSAAALKTIENASVVFVSPISAWEISLKAADGKLELPIEPEEWFEQTVRNHALTIADLSTAILCAANRLPFHHRDPADRFIIATALQENAAVVTSDERFKPYGVRLIS